ncbi:Stress-response A/B barrel domain-containing protein UP3 [Rhynchospora pubera]|uniref:Stress-response A/B barrel domain-containing protein UP3 n=1 Tax=Rhynchospora pubera TaxID=906938 RepID=A0AAV8FJH9_9POAL|nr:Stress-response A/B barrel domain-containing protein UP3 [Rhynchospora pubera]
MRFQPSQLPPSPRPRFIFLCQNETMLCLNLKPLHSVRFRPHSFLVKPQSLRSSSTSLRLSTSASASMSTSSSSTIEHFVLFKLRPSTDPSKIDTMISSLRALSSLPSVSHFSAGPILRLRSAAASELAFTHLLHSRYESKEKLSEYANDPAHVKVVKECVLPIADDVMAVDWVAEGVAPGPIAPGSAIRLTFAKLKEGSDATELTSALASAKDDAGATLVSYGENFSPARAKGYSFGLLAAFPKVDDLEKLTGGHVEAIKEKVKPILESVIVLDFVVSEPPPSSAHL